MRRCFLLFLSLSLMTGCTPEQQILEELQLVQTIGYDYVSEDKILGTGGSTSIPPGQQSLPTDEVFSAVGYTSKQIRQKLQNESTKPIVIGRVGVVLFNQKLAEKGISDLLDNLQRDPEIGRDIFLALAQDSSQKIISTKYSTSVPTSNYIFDLIQQNMEQDMPRINLHAFLYRYYGKGLNAYMPILQKIDDRLKIIGIGIFKDDRLVQQINTEEAYYLKMAEDTIKKGILEIDFKNKKLSIENLSSKPKITVEKRNGSYKTELTLKIKGRISEGGGFRMTSKNIISGIEKTTRKQIEQHMEKLIQSFQENQVDPIGFKRKAMQNRTFSNKKWGDQYAKMPIRVNVEVAIIHAGIME
ncbi:Ger(x)C family spore germination protein [Metabacillus sp. KIGAM252]|uniref:Ger(X)C family spore germination protein n=1 Tax=Metabacillus flavus TaxID=2823519 RepID=A0ABS5LFH7_9BACI|nr:Ger(x)C family spore germination protein [Metabacillus flavus]MBS2969154.1 Ger(x)C family spore germination protein [Metabacillus flavus]